MGYCHVVDMDDEVIAYHLDHMVEKVYEFKEAIEAAVKSSVKEEGKE